MSGVDVHSPVSSADLTSIPATSLVTLAERHHQRAGDRGVTAVAPGDALHPGVEIAQSVALHDAGRRGRCAHSLCEVSQLTTTAVGGYRVVDTLPVPTWSLKSFSLNSI